MPGVMEAILQAGFACLLPQSHDKSQGTVEAQQGFVVETPHDVSNPRKRDCQKFIDHDLGREVQAGSLVRRDRYAKGRGIDEMGGHQAENHAFQATLR